jgi:hypothetical protein
MEDQAAAQRPLPGETVAAHYLDVRVGGAAVRSYPGTTATTLDRGCRDWGFISDNTMTGGHCPSQPIMAWRVVIEPMTGGPHGLAESRLNKPKNQFFAWGKR